MRIFDREVGTCHTVSYRMIEISNFTLLITPNGLIDLLHFA